MSSFSARKKLLEDGTSFEINKKQQLVKVFSEI